MTEGARGTFKRYDWVEYRNPAKGVFRGLEFISSNTDSTFYVGVAGDTDSDGKHSKSHYEQIAKLIIKEKKNSEWPENTEVQLSIGSKTKTVLWMKVADKEEMKDCIKYGLTDDKIELWSDEARKEAAKYLQSDEFKAWKKKAEEFDLIQKT